MSECEKRLEKAVALAEGLKHAGFSVNVLVCRDGVPCLSAYKKPTRKIMAKFPKYFKKREGERV